MTTEQEAVDFLLDTIQELRNALAGREHAKGQVWQRLRDDLGACTRELVSVCGCVPLFVIPGSWHADTSRVHAMLQGRDEHGPR